MSASLTASALRLDHVWMLVPLPPAMASQVAAEETQRSQDYSHKL